jgi:hypothetical protein
MRITLNIGAGLSFYRVPSGSCKGSAGEERIEEEADREKSMFRGPFIPRIELMCLIGLLSLLGGRSSLAQKAPEGIWEGYDGEWQHVSAQLIALAEATPEEKFAWRPALVTGPKMPADLKEEMEKTVTSKADVISWLKRSLEAVRQAHLAETPERSWAQSAHRR